MHEPDGLETAEQGGKLGELHRLPQRETRNHDENADQNDAEIKNLLHGVVVREIVMAEPKPQRLADRRQYLAHGNGKQLAPETTGGDAVSQIGEAVEHENPHAEEVPLQPVLRPFADGQKVGEMQPAENHVVVINLPAAADHDENRDRVDPMHDAKRQRMQLPFFGRDVTRNMTCK